ncbi:MAG: hypothetical protein ACP5HI_08500, partial [Caldimicrobium sp.]
MYELKELMREFGIDNEGLNIMRNKEGGDTYVVSSGRFHNDCRGLEVFNDREKILETFKGLGEGIFADDL